MNQTNKNRPSFTESARELRRQTLSNLLNDALVRFTARFTDSLRNHHEAWLRRAAMRTPRMKSVIGTPV